MIDLGLRPEHSLPRRFIFPHWVPKVDDLVQILDIKSGDCYEGRVAFRLYSRGQCSLRFSDSGSEFIEMTEPGKGIEYSSHHQKREVLVFT